MKSNTRRRSRTIFPPEDGNVRVALFAPKIQVLGGFGYDPFHDYLSRVFSTWLLDVQEEVKKKFPECQLVALSGMDPGAPQWWAQGAMGMGIPVHAYLPFKGMGSTWPRAAQNRLQDLLEACDRVWVEDEGSDFSIEALVNRDHRMIQEADYRLALTDGVTGCVVEKNVEFGQSIGVSTTLYSLQKLRMEFERGRAATIDRPRLGVTIGDIIKAQQERKH